MDFPLILSRDPYLGFAYDYQELKQDIYLLLRQWYGSFLQSPQMGSRVAPHVADSMLLRTGVTATIGQIQGCECRNVSVSGEHVYVTVVYRGVISEFTFSLSTFER